MTELDNIFIYNNELLYDCKEQINYYYKIKSKLSESIGLYEFTIIIINTLQILLPIAITLFESLKTHINTLSEFQINLIPITLSSSLTLFIAFSKYFQFETTLATMNNVDLRYTFIIARLRHRERCILKNKTINKDEIDKMLIEFELDTLDSYIEQTLNDTDAKFKNIAMKDVDTRAILKRQYLNRTTHNFKNSIDIEYNQKSRRLIKRLCYYLWTCCWTKKVKIDNPFNINSNSNVNVCDLSPEIQLEQEQEQEQEQSQEQSQEQEQEQSQEQE